MVCGNFVSKIKDVQVSSVKTSSVFAPLYGFQIYCCYKFWQRKLVWKSQNENIIVNIMVVLHVLTLSTLDLKDKEPGYFYKFRNFCPGVNMTR